MTQKIYDKQIYLTHRGIFTGTTTPGQSRTASNGNERLLRTL